MNCCLDTLHSILCILTLIFRPGIKDLLFVSLMHFLFTLFLFPIFKVIWVKRKKSSKLIDFIYLLPNCIFISSSKVLFSFWWMIYSSICYYHMNCLQKSKNKYMNCNYYCYELQCFYRCKWFRKAVHPNSGLLWGWNESASSIEDSRHDGTFLTLRSGTLAMEFVPFWFAFIVYIVISTN